MQETHHFDQWVFVEAALELGRGVLPDLMVIFFASFSEFQLPLPEEAHPGGGAAEHGDEPDRGGHR